MYREEYMDSLYHSGILGMKWGKRNGPPYPLKPWKRSAAEKKAAKKAAREKASEESKEPTPEEVTIKMQKEISRSHPDSKYKDSRKFGVKDLDRLKDRFKSEKEYNEALASKLKSEDDLKDAMLKSMSKKQKKDLYNKMVEMEVNAAYNDTIRKSIDSQIKLLESQKRLKELNRELNAKPPKPKTKMQKAKEYVGGIMLDIGKSSLTDVGKKASTYLIGTGINKMAGKEIIDVKTGGKAKSEIEKRIDKLNEAKSLYDAEFNYNKSKYKLEESNKGNTSIYDDKDKDKNKN